MPLAQQSCAGSLSGMADVHIRLKQFTEARAVLDEAIERMESARSYGKGKGKGRIFLERSITELKTRRDKLAGR